MNTVIALVVLSVLLAGVWVLLERTARRAGGRPHAPLGADLTGDVDLLRVLHDLDARGRAA